MPHSQGFSNNHILCRIIPIFCRRPLHSYMQSIENKTFHTQIINIVTNNKTRGWGLLTGRRNVRRQKKCSRKRVRRKGQGERGADKNRRTWKTPFLIIECMCVYEREIVKSKWLLNYGTIPNVDKCKLVTRKVTRIRIVCRANKSASHDTSVTH